MSHSENAFASMQGGDLTGSIGPKQASSVPTDADLAFVRNAASDVLTRGDKDSSQPWQNPQSGAHGSVTPIASSYADNDGRSCRDVLASYVNGHTERWLQGSACRTPRGHWEIRTLKPWKQG
jgi:surface antigen